MIDTTRRAFLRRTGAASGAWSAMLAAAALLPAGAPAIAANSKLRLWKSADILVGQSTAPQAPALSITCPLYYANGHPAGATHGLDLSVFPVQGDITWNGDTIVPDLGASLAVSTAPGTDGQLYLLVGAEGAVTSGTGRFSGVDRVIVRCKYQVVPASPLPLLVACVSCVVVLVQG